VSTAAESIAPPHPWMMALWNLDPQGLPIRHRPDRTHVDLWTSRCSDEAKYRFVFLMDCSPLRSVMELTPCLECAELDES
jgi:hypothetical protein